MSVVNRLLSMVGFPRVSAPAVETGAVQLLQASHQTTGETHDGVPSVQLFGFSSSPEIGCDLVVVFAEGDRSKGVAIASNDQRFRPRGLAAGESQQYDSAGQSVYLKNGSSITISSKGGVLAATISPGGVSTTGNLVAGNGATGSFTTATGNIVTVQDGIITNIF